VTVRLTPEDGDVVVREEGREGNRTYVLHTAPGPDQWTFHTQGAALAWALALAEHQQVRVWLTDEGYDFTLVRDVHREASV
jgi:hypothetical protein